MTAPKYEDIMVEPITFDVGHSTIEPCAPTYEVTILGHTLTSDSALGIAAAVCERYGERAAWVGDDGLMFDASVIARSYANDR